MSFDFAAVTSESELAEGQQMDEIWPFSDMKLKGRCGSSRALSPSRKDPSSGAVRGTDCGWSQKADTARGRSGNQSRTNVVPIFDHDRHAFPPIQILQFFPIAAPILSHVALEAGGSAICGTESN
jgi:hypothetical protein